MNETLYCGAAREVITPSKELLPDLRGLMNREFGGIVDDLYVRVIVLRSCKTEVMFASFDMDKAPCPEKGLRMLEEETGVPQDHIFYTAIHTHSAPITGERPHEGPNALKRKPPQIQAATIRYENYVLEKMILAARRAFEGLEPAVVGYGFGNSFVNVKRLTFYETVGKDGELHTVAGTGTNFQEEVDRTLFVMRFESVSGKPIAFMINYPVHNTVMIMNAYGTGGKVGISSDLGGNVSNLMENIYVGAVCIWTSGAAGDINPVMSNQVYREDPDNGRPVEVYETNGVIAQSMLKTLTAHHFYDIRKVDRKLSASTKESHLSLSAAFDWAVVEGQNEDGQPVPYKVRVHRMSIGHIILFGFSGELYSGLGKRLRERFIAEIADPETIVLFVNHDGSLLYNTEYIFGDEIFRISEQYECDIPGLDHTWLRPGHIEEALFLSMKKLLQTDGTEGWSD